MKRVLNLKKGDKCIVAIEKNSNASRNKDMSLKNIENWTYEGEVISVGRKYITVNFGEYNTGKFEIDNNYRKKVACGTNDYILYQNIKQIKDEIECVELTAKIRGVFQYNYNAEGLTLDQLRKISDILDEK